MASRAWSGIDWEAVVMQAATIVRSYRTSVTLHIDRDFTRRCGCWDQTVRVALTREQVEEHQLPINPGKATDSRAGAFVERHGSLMQVEPDALPPEDMRCAYQNAFDRFWDPAAYDLLLDREGAEREVLSRAVESFRSAQ